MTADTPLRRGQLVGLDQLQLWDFEHDELRDAHARLDHEAVCHIRVEQDHLQLPAVPRVDQPRRVDDRNPVPIGETRAWLNEAGITLRDSNREACADDRALAGTKLEPVARRQVEARIAGIGTLG